MRSDRLVTLVLLVSHELRRSLKNLVKWICGACSRCFGTWGQQDSARTLGPSRWKAGGEMELHLPAEFQAVPCLSVLGRRSRFPQQRNFVCFKLFVPEKRWPIPLPWPIPGLSLMAPARMASAPTSQLGSGGSPSHPPVQSWMTKNGRIRWQKKDAGATGRVVDRIWWMLNTIWVLFEIIPTEVICGSFWVVNTRLAHSSSTSSEYVCLCMSQSERLLWIVQPQYSTSQKICSFGCGGLHDLNILNDLECLEVKWWKSFIPLCSVRTLCSCWVQRRAVWRTDADGPK